MKEHTHNPNFRSECFLLKSIYLPKGMKKMGMKCVDYAIYIRSNSSFKYSQNILHSRTNIFHLNRGMNNMEQHESQAVGDHVTVGERLTIHKSEVYTV